MKKLFLMIATVAMLTACNGNGNTSGKASGEQNDSNATEQTDKASPSGMEEGSKGPGTLEANAFTIDVPEGWEVTKKSDEELGVKPQGGKVFSFQYSDQANHEQEKQIMMNLKDMKDLGEKQFGDNTYHLYMWEQEFEGTFKALLKIGDGQSGSIEVTCSGLEDANSEVVGQILPNVKMK